MKKLMFSFMLLVAALYSVETKAQYTSDEFNFQGVCAEKGKEVDVVFCILNNNNDSVYVESQKVMTNQNGAFSTRIGKGERLKGNWSNLDWAYTNYKIQVSINDEVIALSDFAYVPYAKVARQIGSLSEDDIHMIIKESQYRLDEFYYVIQNELDGIENKFAEQNAKIQTLRQSLEELENVMNGRLAGHEVMINKLMEIVSGFNAAISSFEARIIQQEGKIDQQNQKLVIMENILNEQKDMINYLANNLEYLNSMINSINAMVAEQANVVKAIEVTVESQNSKIEGQNQIIADMKTIVDLQNSKMEKQEEIVYGLNTVANEQKAKIEEQENRINNLEAVIETQNQIIAKQDIVNNEQNTVILELQKRLEENEPLMNKLKVLLEELER